MCFQISVEKGCGVELGEMGLELGEMSLCSGPTNKGRSGGGSRLGYRQIYFQVFIDHSHACGNRTG